MGDELKPCPFCGAKVRFIVRDIGVAVWCESDPCGSALSNWHGSQDAAAAEWNTRHLTPKQQCADEMYEMLRHILETENLWGISADVDALLAKARGE